MKTSNRRGSALLTVLWLSACLAAIAFSVSSSVRSETDRVEASSNGLRAWYLATGAVERGIQWMLWGEAYRNPDGSPRFWQFGAPRMNMTFPSGNCGGRNDSGIIEAGYQSCERRRFDEGDYGGQRQSRSQRVKSRERFSIGGADRRGPPTINITSASVRLFGPGTRLFKR